MSRSLTFFCLVQLSIVLSVEGVSMIINPSTMVIGSRSVTPVKQLQLRCSSDGTDNIEALYRLEISRKRSTDPNFVTVAAIDDYKIIKNFTSDMRSPNATGHFVHVAAGDPPTSGSLIVTMDGDGLTCSDQAEFKCTMTFKMLGETNLPVSQKSNFTVITAPNDVHIIDAQYEENGEMKQLGNDKSFKVGTRIMYKCSANIGSDSSVSISWERSPVLGASTDFIPYNPAEPTDIVQDPVISAVCSNHRTSSMYYSLTSSDSDGVTFQCKVRSYLNNEWYHSTSQQRRVFTVRTPGDNAEGKASDTTATEAGIIAGAVIGSIAVVIIIIILVYFLWYRKRNTKEPTRTVEEVESLDPPPTGNIYSRPEKKKRTNLGAKVGDRDGRKAPESSEVQYADLELPKQPRPIPRKSKAKTPPVVYTEIRFNNS